MKFVYLDPGLVNELGHHANFCRHIVHEVRSRNIPVLVFGHTHVTQDLKSAWQVIPKFRWSTYARFVEPGHAREDPLHGWLKNFDVTWQLTVQDMMTLGPIYKDDIVFLNSALPGQFMAMVQWLRQIPPDERPKVVMELHLDPGIALSTQGDPGSFNAPEPHVNDRPILNRYIASFLTPEDRSSFKPITFEEAAAPLYSLLLSYPVEAWPLPYFAVTDRRSRVGKRAFTVSVLGHQRWDKGYHLVPEIAALLLQQRQDIVVMVHNGLPDSMPEVQQKLRKVADQHERLVLNENVAGPELWRQLLDISDVIICPYNPMNFATRYSAVATEAVVNGIPLVVPANTSLSKLLEEFGGSGTQFESQNTEAVVEATLRLLDNYDLYASSATAASSRWEQLRGAGTFVSRLLDWAQVPTIEREIMMPPEATPMPVWIAERG